MNHNPYEDAARAKKVIAILSVIPAGRMQIENDMIAQFLETLSKDQRQVFEILADCKRPASDTTWEMVRAAARARHIPGDGGAFDRTTDLRKPDFDAQAREQFHSAAHKFKAEQCPRCERIGRAMSDAFEAGMTATIRAVGL